jgi:hypothetical protein
MYGYPYQGTFKLKKYIFLHKFPKMINIDRLMLKI